MFENRLKIFLGVLFVVTAALLARAVQLQILQRHAWQDLAAVTMRREQSIETMRGTILDRRGVPLAQDVAGIDACVDYRVIVDPPDKKWVDELASSRVRKRLGDEYRAADAAGRTRLREVERELVLARIDVMWATLARESGRTSEEIAESRHAIIRRVEMRRRWLWYRKFDLAREAFAKREPSPKWQRWLLEDSDQAPDLDKFDVVVSEQTEAHPILRNISPETNTRLGKALDDLPGLVLRPGMHREYPAGEASCHLVGGLSRVTADDIRYDHNRDDDSLKYEFNDQVGRRGLEALCEPLLRGRRGRISRNLSDDSRIVDEQPAVFGTDVRTTIDIQLQQEIVEAFKHARVDFAKRGMPAQPYSLPLHGGAVVISVPTGEVLALASNPGFDPNLYDEKYAELSENRLDRPLMNRATQFALEPGSTVKPLLGLGAITQGILGINEGIECTGYLEIAGKRITQYGRCWVARQFPNLPNGPAHHPIPVPHVGHDGNRDGFLTFTDALERSCNVYFEVVGNRLGLEAEAYWMDRFGLGRTTGIGIAEAVGRTPRNYQGRDRLAASWMAAIGQGSVAATPLQMANVAATIARSGVWMRPTLLPPDMTETLRKAPATQPGWRAMPDSVDLNLSPAALQAAREGMTRVVRDRSGTAHDQLGRLLAGTGLTVAAKTGSAQSQPLRLPRIEDGKIVRDERGRIIREEIEPSTAQQINPECPWYLSFEDGQFTHAWIIGFAPADDPQIAFAVMVEFGGTGGKTAAGIARELLRAGVEPGYLTPNGRVTRVQQD
ncbi:MAG: peptidoglycan D,D-transpeptidase FtsI family protein [Tepidisphaeraceae bacterium]